MAAKTKKVILFIVEGPTDETALSPVLKKIFQNEEIRFHVVHGDVALEWLVNSTNAINVINKHIKVEMDLYGFRRSDILKVIHLIDTDGAFIPNDRVIDGDVERPVYKENNIIVHNPETFKKRNAKKRQVIGRLYHANTIGSFPYSVYYFSRNMEHVLHNNGSDLTDDEKMDYADQFADTYYGHPEAFIDFLSDSDFTVQGNYRESWRFIFNEINSLHRHSNLHLLFKNEA